MHCTCVDAVDAAGVESAAHLAIGAARARDVAVVRLPVQAEMISAVTLLPHLRTTTKIALSVLLVSRTPLLIWISRCSQMHSPILYNKKQCSRQLQCEVPCSIGNVINSSLFINSSLSSLSSTSHTVRGGPGGVWAGGSGHGGLGRGGGPWGAGDILVQLPYTALPHGASP